MKYKIGYAIAFMIAFAENMVANVSESRSIITINLTGAGTLALSPDAKPVVGDEVILKVSSDATARDLTFGNGFTAPVLKGVINKTKVQNFVYDGTNFIPTGTALQIN